MLISYIYSNFDLDEMWQMHYYSFGEGKIFEFSILSQCINNREVSHFFNVFIKCFSKKCEIKKHLKVL